MGYIIGERWQKTHWICVFFFKSREIILSEEEKEKNLGGIKGVQYNKIKHGDDWSPRRSRKKLREKNISENNDHTLPKFDETHKFIDLWISVNVSGPQPNKYKRVYPYPCIYGQIVVNQRGTEIFRAAWEKRHFAYEGPMIHIQLTSNWKQQRRKECTAVPVKNVGQPRLLHPAKCLPERGDIEVFSDKRKWRKYIIRHTSVQEIPKFFRLKGNKTR